MTVANRFSPARWGRLSCSTVLAAPHGVVLVFVRDRVLVAIAGNVAQRLSEVSDVSVADANMAVIDLFKAGEHA